MSRQTKAVNTSLPLDVYQELEDLAEKKGISRSQILRLALVNYVDQEKRWQRIYEIGEKRAKELGIKSEEDVERLIHEFRKEYSETKCKE
jgi:metal-responsive CopG/Arc/MetJ family transcriptional regulator